MSQPRRIVILGGIGFVGTHLANALLERGRKVTVVDSLDVSSDPEQKQKTLEMLGRNPSFTFVERDVRDREMLTECFRINAVEVVVNLSASTEGEDTSTVGGVDALIRSTLSALEAMRLTDVRRLVHVSSFEVYGNSVRPASVETDRTDAPLSPFAAAVIATEHLCHAYHVSHLLETFALRLFKVYGPGQRRDALLPHMLDCILHGSPVRVPGNGSNKFDCVYVDDVVDALITSIDRVKGYEVLNVGSGRSASTMELIRTMELRTGKKAIIESVPFPAGEVFRSCADIKKAHRILGFIPQVSLIEGIGRLQRWTAGARIATTGSVVPTSR